MFKRIGSHSTQLHRHLHSAAWKANRPREFDSGLSWIRTPQAAFSLLAIVSIVLSSSAVAQHLFKTADDVNTFYTDVGKIGLTITNFGTLGTRNASWPNQPSCEYPLGSRIEHMYQAGFWVGAKARNSGLTAQVSTGATDRSGNSGEGYEFTTENGTTMIERSSLADSKYFQQNAISHQDFDADYSDVHTRVPATGDSIPNHIPLGLAVHQESYAWNFPFTNDWVILSYTIRNVSGDTLDDVYAGIWCDNVVRNTNYVRPGATGYYYYCAGGYDSLARMMYTFEGNPSPGNTPANSYIGLAVLGATPFPNDSSRGIYVDSLGDLYHQTFFNAWIYRNSAGVQALFSPTDDYNASPYLSRYTRMTQSIPQPTIDAMRTTPANYTTLISTGPWHRLAPNDSIQVVFAVVCAEKAGNEYEGLDKPDQRENLYDGLRWAQRCYNGEDVNGNDRLDPGEDIVRRVPGGLQYGADGILTRYVLPTPPPQPHVRAEVGDHKATIYWDKSPEYALDPISGIKDFEGYRIYRTTAGSDFLNNQNWLLNIPLVGDFDRADDSIGYNTGFNSILIDTSSLFTGKTFPGDTTKYFYQFPPKGTDVTQLNGWQYVYGVSAYDQGDPANNLNSLESAIKTVSVISGTTPTSNQSTSVGVYPNPYYAHAYWDGNGERYRKIYFYNLPVNATITIYTLAGDVVARLDHSSTNAGTDIRWFQEFSSSQTPQFSGGEQAWDLISQSDQAIATGLYLFTVKDKDTGTIKRGKFVVIK